MRTHAHNGIVIENDEGESITLPMKWEICGECQGEGKSCAYLGSFSREDFDNDPDFADEYFAGTYDRACGPCGGSGKVKEVDEERLDEATKKFWHAWQKDEAEYAAQCEMERRMGA